MSEQQIGKAKITVGGQDFDVSNATIISNFQEEDMVKLEGYIRELEESISSHIGVAFTAETNEQTIENLKKAIYNIMPKEQLKPGDCEVHTMWHNMSVREKALWWFFRHFFKEVGENIRSSIDAANKNTEELWFDTRSEEFSFASDEYEECPEKIDYPRIFHPLPKNTIEVKMKVMGNINHVSVSMTVEI